MRKLRYERMGIPRKYWNLKPLVFIKKRKILKTVWSRLLESLQAPNNRGAILESDKDELRSTFGAAILKYMTARHLINGRWLYLPDVIHKITSTKFNDLAWAEFRDDILKKDRIVVIDNFDVRRINNSDDIINGLYDFFYKLFNNSEAKVLILTPNPIHVFESTLDQQLTALLDKNINLWSKV